MHKSIKHALDSWYGHVIEIFDDGNGKYSFKDEYGKLHQNLTLKQATEMFDEAYQLKPYNSCRNAVTGDPFIDKTPSIGDRVYLYVVGKRRSGTVKDKSWLGHLIVKWDNGDVDEVRDSEVRLLNSTCNSVVANAIVYSASLKKASRLKEGDTVKVRGMPGKFQVYRRFPDGMVDYDDNTSSARFQYLLAPYNKDGSTVFQPEDLVINSYNSTVRNALAWKANNAGGVSFEGAKLCKKESDGSFTVKQIVIGKPESAFPVLGKFKTRDEAERFMSKNAMSRQRIEIDEGDMVSDLKGRWHGPKEVIEVGRDWVQVEGGMTIHDTDMLVVNSVATNAEFTDKFEVGKVYRAPWDRDWLCKVLSRSPTSIRVATKSIRDKSWGAKDEQVTLRINPRKSEEADCEVARGYDWEFWASEKA